MLHGSAAVAELKPQDAFRTVQGQRGAQRQCCRGRIEAYVVSVAPGGAPGNDSSYDPAVSADGSIVAFSGLRETGDTNTAVEIYQVGAGWSPEYVAPWTPPLYPRMHLLPNGTLFYSGPTAASGRGSTLVSSRTSFSKRFLSLAGT